MSPQNYIHSDVVSKKMSLRELIVKLWPYLKRHKVQLLFISIAVGGVAFTGRMLPTIIGLAVDNGFMKKDVSYVIKMAGAYLIIEVVRSYLSFAHLYYFQKLGNRILFYVREDLLTHIQNLPTRFFDRTPSGRLVTRLTNDVSGLGELFTDGIISIIAHVVSMLSILIAMSLISFKLTCLVLVATPIFLYLSVRLSKKIRITLEESKRRLAMINAFVAENISGMRVVQLYNRESKTDKKFQNLSEDYRKIQMDSVKNYALFWPTMNGFTAVTLTSSLYFGGVFSAEQGLAIGSLIAFIMHIQDFINPLSEILEKYQQFQNSLTSADRIFAILNETEERQHGSHSKSQKVGQIEFKNFSFQYASDLPEVLNHINLKIKPGQSTAIVGRTGSGKSTLVSLLQGLYEYKNGEILIDELPVSQWNLKELRRRVGIVAQDNFLFRGTIFENITLRDPRILETQVQRACEIVGLSKVLKNRHGGLQTFVEERGANLSAGERQLISFARFLVFDPEILILDEATSNIDSESEKLIQEATKQIAKNRTSIVIAHRLSTIRDSDQIVCLENGKIIETGSHQELLSQQGAYAQLVHNHIQGGVIT